MSVAASPVHSLVRYRDEFPVFGQATYLNSCSLGALSRRSRARVNDYLDLWDQRGAAAWYDTWLPALDELRAGYAAVVGADPAEISLHPSISGALGVVSEALDYRDRPKVVVTSLDFPTIAYQWQAKRAEGVEVVVVESPDDTEVPLELLDQAIDERTAIVATSHVFFTSGAVQDIAALARMAHQRGALILIDGYQGAGQLPVDVHAAQVDFYCSGGLKWLLGGSGTAFLYARSGLAASLEPRVTGWFAHADPFAFDPRRLNRRPDARGLETGTPAMGSVYAQLGGLEIIREIGIPAIHAVTRDLTEDLITQAQARGFRPRVARRREDRSGIVMLPRAAPHDDVRRLGAAGFVVDARPGHVRVSPYFYNRPEDHRAMLERLARE
jgi:selenocysteine lyase/cysteine desulfurase